jgi:hypothetical protein
MTTKYQVTELDKALQQAKEGFPEWTNEQQLEYQLEIQKEFHKKSLERKSIENVELYTDNVLLKRQIRELEKENIDLRFEIILLKEGLTPIGELQSEDDQYWCKDTDENGNKIPMTKVKGSRVMSKEEVKELNKVKLPF